MEAKPISRGRRRDYTRAPQITLSYLLGVLHDATEGKYTYRIGSKDKSFCKVLSSGIKNLGAKAWVYQEGKNRDFWITEFSKNLLKNFQIKSQVDKIDYIRGYFDAEGGIARSNDVRYYIYFAQKDRLDLLKVKTFLEELSICCGKIHNPSKRVDKNYWRFFVSSKSYTDFARIINSSHPEKRKCLRMKI